MQVRNVLQGGRRMGGDIVVPQEGGNMVVPQKPLYSLKRSRSKFLLQNSSHNFHKTVLIILVPGTMTLCRVVWLVFRSVNSTFASQDQRFQVRFSIYSHITCFSSLFYHYTVSFVKFAHTIFTMW
ncbi:hypothetical protein CEXT_737681 [Caerostris extrusa]|uniref:Uncharacterized protein n=1 Tax=Caerostris extrusa TaxID=172846 RepID=A0AAV4Y9G9_CAEEX|nr:hypothetical protein CEXT_737681 [Caerostris extrusa]